MIDLYTLNRRKTVFITFDQGDESAHLLYTVGQLEFNQWCWMEYISVPLHFINHVVKFKCRIYLNVVEL